MQKRVNLVDLVKSFPTSIYYLLFTRTCKIRLRYSRQRASQSLPQISQKLEKKLGKNTGPRRGGWPRPAHDLGYGG